MLKEYTVFAKIAIVLSLVFGSLIALQQTAELLIDIGRDERQALWDIDKLNQKIIIQDMLTKAKETSDKIHQGVVNEYKQELEDAKRDYDKRIADAKSNGGLRMPKTACRAVSTNEPTVAASTEGSNEASTDRLPERIESGLYALAGKCQAVVIQLDSLQKWVTDSGMFKEVLNEN